MDILLGIAFVWLVITLLGHLSWVILAWFFKALAGAEQKLSQVPQAESDVAAAHRVVSQLVAKRVISPDEAEQWRTGLRSLATNKSFSSESHQPLVSQAEPNQPDSESADWQVIDPSQISAEDSLATATLITSDETEVHSDASLDSDVCVDPFDEFSVDQPASDSVFDRVSTPPIGSPNRTELGPAGGTVKAKAGRSFAELMADHNVRWGELIAGILIVVCSIGLVVSLWSTITDMHRVVPSMIFMLGNASIFFAGLYTLFRWKLQSSSRATLVIGTLLVPLGILAGLSTDGIGSSTVQLTDPITVAAILGCGAVYVWLIWKASQALVGRSLAPAMTLGVAGPSMFLPFLPAAFRAFGDAAGWFSLGGSISIALVLWMLTRQRVAKPTSGRAVRSGLVLAVTSFSLTVLAGYAAFVVRSQASGWLAVADATMIGYVLLATIAVRLLSHRSLPKLSLVAQVSCVLLFGAASVIAIPSLQSVGWIWAWAICLSITAGISGWLMRQAQWVAVVIAPLGLASVLSSTMLGGALWESTTLFEKLLSGEAMVAAVLVSCVNTAFLWLTHRQNTGQRVSTGPSPLLCSSAGWFVYTSIVAAALIVLPVERMGIVPPAVISLILAAASFVGLRLLRKTSLIVPSQWLVIGATTAFWMSVIKPIQIGQEFEGLLPVTLVLLTSSMTLLLFGEFWNCRRARMKPLRMSAAMFAVFASATTIGSFVIGTVDEGGWQSLLHIGAAEQSIIVLLFTATVLAIVGFGDRLSELIGSSRIAIAVMAGIAAFHYGYDWLFMISRWQDSTAIWSWSLLFWILAIAIVIRNEALILAGRWQQNQLRQSSGIVERVTERLAWYQPAQHAWDHSSMMGYVVLAVVGVCLATIHGFATVLGTSWIEPLYFELMPAPRSLLLPGVVFLLFAGFQWMRFRRSGESELFSAFNGVILAASVGWIALQAAILLIQPGSNRIIFMTTVSFAGYLLLELVIHRLPKLQRCVPQPGVLASVAVAVLACSSMSLMSTDWMPAVSEGTKPVLATTCWIAGWWAMASMAFAWVGQRSGRSYFEVGSVILVPAIAVLVGPLFDGHTWLFTAQVAALACGVYAVSVHWLGIKITTAIHLAAAICMVSAVANSVAVTVAILLPNLDAHAFHWPFGIALSASAVLISANLKWLDPSIRKWNVPIEFYGLLLSGHFACLLAAAPIGWMTDMVSLKIVWTSVCGLSFLFQVWCAAADSHRLGRYQTAVLVIVLTMLTLVGGLSRIDNLIGLIACAIGVLMISHHAMMRYADQSRSAISKTSIILSRLFSLYCLFVGCVLTGFVCEMMAWSPALQISCVLGWAFVCLVIWRCCTPDISDSPQLSGRCRLLADREASVLLLAAVVVELVMTPFTYLSTAQHVLDFDGWSLARIAGYLIASASVIFRCNRKGTLEVAMLTILSAIALATVHIAGTVNAGIDSIVTTTALTVSMTIVLQAYWLPLIGRGIDQIRRSYHDWMRCAVKAVSDKTASLQESNTNIAVGASDASLVFHSLRIETLARALVRVVGFVAILIGGLCLTLLVTENNDSATPLSICSLVLLAVAAGELAERAMMPRFRYVALGLGFSSVAMWCSTSIVDQDLPTWVLTTRWFVAWIVVAVIQSVALPKLFTEGMLQRWGRVVRHGTGLAILLAAVSLAATLVQEFLIRTNNQTELLSRPLYLGVAVVLGAMTVLTTFASIASGPGFRYREIWKLSDQQRGILVVAAQAIGGLTWFHLFLCKSPLASLGLRAYWPYIVMILAFVSVGITEWSRRRQDEVLSAVLKRTALFLPLIPVLGFWLSGSLVSNLFGDYDESSWTFARGHVSYQTLLIVAAFYYGVISVIWKSPQSRLLSILLGNIALWVVLIQVPGWSFLTHPQAWLIPPAVCVLVLSHMHRDRLGKEATQAIRYATTLLIYISSSADMLIQGIGSTLAGPIVLICLALAGAGAGVVLRIRPFLYLGTIFVFIGVTSMVWHAGQQMNAVWPWWVFGIGTGIGLMVALMAIEKNKPKLRQIATSMQQWDT
ncbi:hypothetical protein LOC67_05505 [Stieleria sp. JC731]|uniref:hypothetical protein n=1 Tax=Pirellulaceae TaxID=2691357 RepID=UPI001E29470C|nr:hypothetical protein [Stieleria sp. JC731]MCC9600010.1 hypothetical protein [Stieleria sp. JC731]